MGFCIKGFLYSYIVQLYRRRGRVSTMRLHYYARPVPHPYYLGVHYGHGFGSVFARLFSKIAAKTAAKTALSAAKVAGRKVLRVAARHGKRLATEAATKGIEEAKKYGKDLIAQGIDTLSQSAINKGLPADTVHNVSDIARKGAHTVVDQLGTAAGSRLEEAAARVHNKIGDLVDVKRISDTSSLHTRSPPVKKIPVAGSKIQHHRRQKRKHPQRWVSSSAAAAHKRGRYLQNLIDEA